MIESASLVSDLRDIAVGSGADLFGVADLSPARSSIEGIGGAAIAAFPRAISIAMLMSPDMVEPIVDRENIQGMRAYRYYNYEVLNQGLDRIDSLLVRRLRREGYRAYLVPASDLDRQRLHGVFPHKTAAYLAGHGFIGKACLLVAGRYGARLRLGTVLTDAPLEPGAPKEGTCGDCHRCVEVCPPKAIKGVEFRPEDPREARLDARLCHAYLDGVEKTLGTRSCGLCLMACDGSHTSP